MPTRPLNLSLYRLASEEVDLLSATSTLAVVSTPADADSAFDPALIIYLVLVSVISVSLSLVGHSFNLDLRAHTVAAVFACTVVALIVSATPVAVVVLAALIVLTLANAWVCDTQTGHVTFANLSRSFETAQLALNPHSSLSNISNGPPQCASQDESFKIALKGFSLPLSWLVWSAFNIGLAVEKSGLGRRIALMIVRTFGSSPFTLGPCLFLIELFSGLLIPSNTARGGALIHPIVVSLGNAFSHAPEIQRYLILSGMQANLVSSSAWFYGTVGNPILAEAAQELLDVEFGFVEWITGSIVPILALTIILPPILWRFSMTSKSYPAAFRSSDGASNNSTTAFLSSVVIASTNLDSSIPHQTLPGMHPPSVVNPFSATQPSSAVPSSAVPSSAIQSNSSSQHYVSLTQSSSASSMQSISQAAHNNLLMLGPTTNRERRTAIILALCLSAWVFDLLPDGLIGLTGLSFMLLCGVLSWEDVRDNGQAWDSFFWLAGMVLIVEQMNKLGISQAVGLWCQEVLVEGFSPVAAAVLLAVFYFASMYLFSSITSHIVALSTPLLLAGKAAGCPPLLLTALLCYSSGLCACLTSYSSGITVMYFSQNMFSKREWTMNALEQPSTTPAPNTAASPAQLEPQTTPTSNGTTASKQTKPQSGQPTDVPVPSISKDESIPFPRLITDFPQLVSFESPVSSTGHSTHNGTLSDVLENNLQWSTHIQQTNPGLFEKLNLKQMPEILWIGCSDARVPAESICGLGPGDLFVHRNIANVVVHTDLSMLSVVQYAVDILKVKHIVVCGHYKCGGCMSAMSNKQFGLIDNWLRNIKDIYSANAERLDLLEEAEKGDVLVELNVAKSVWNLCHTTIVQNAWDRGQQLSVHGWVYRLSNGRIEDLQLCITQKDEVNSVYSYVTTTGIHTASRRGTSISEKLRTPNRHHASGTPTQLASRLDSLEL
ncbi:carbonic anhydrase [Chytriomyces confervae]|uniref:Carbonic anhydrase n=1 Tax=Chytriomyces confervae TaxID=246404 RepID=A0A507FD48_9FUNG|nr:carbonic anhydrase [Chytriomyces confervae]